MTRLTDEQFERLCNHLDGSPSDETETAALDGAQRREIRRLREIDAGIRRLYAPLVDDAGVEAPLRTPPKASESAVWVRAIAACLGAAVIGVLVWVFLLPGAPPKRALALNGTALYRQAERDLTPRVVCDTPQKFEVYTRETFGVPVTARFDGQAELIGWRGVSPAYGDFQHGRMQARVLLASAPDGSPIVVLFQDRLQPPPTASQRSGLQVYGREFGEVAAWEISASDQPLVLDVLGLVGSP